MPNLLIGARGAGDFSAAPKVGNWSRYNLCDIVRKASVAFVVSTDPDVHFKCCISADSKVQASIKHETKGKPIKACRVHSVHLTNSPVSNQTASVRCCCFSN